MDEYKQELFKEIQESLYSVLGSYYCWKCQSYTESGYLTEILMHEIKHLMRDYDVIRK